MSVPHKFRRLGDFAEYYSGMRKAPVMTLFVGGNHEASNYLSELYYGGWVAPNIYYMGAANVVDFGGLRIAGISGIWAKHDYMRGHFEKLPYDHATLRSIYHVRQYDVKKLLLLSQDRPIDIFLSHDWPRGIEQHGDVSTLLRKKPFFKSEVERNDLGSPANEQLLRMVRPRYWFSAHLHVRFEAIVDHVTDGQKRLLPEDTDWCSAIRRAQRVPMRSDDTRVDAAKNPDEIILDLEDEPQDITKSSNAAENCSVANPNEIQLDLDEFEDSFTTREELDVENALPEATKQSQAAGAVPPSRTTYTKTKFLALDKCVSNRQYLQILDICPELVLTNIPVTQVDFQLKYDQEWLAITRVMQKYYSSGRYQTSLPPEGELRRDVHAQMSWVQSHMTDLNISENFCITAPVHSATLKPDDSRIRLLAAKHTLIA